MTVPRRYICVHGHFYQPPRENAWLEAIEVQDSAAPYHDWNERINHECYAANGSSRILNAEGQIVRIVNNYSRISFNFGPTLLGWMEKFAPLSYQRVLDADRASRERFGGHGSAIAQVYNHIILPLAATRDRIRQIRWGIADFEHRFHRRPEGMWLAETAVDLESLDLLAQHGIRFTILAPHQCARIRPLSAQPDGASSEWQETPSATVDPTQPYLVRTREGRGIAVFFYNGPLSRAIAFERLLNDGGHLADRLLHAYNVDGRPAQLAHIATDGESYGHHHRHGDMALAYALHAIETGGQAQLTNYGQFLELFPPTSEAEIVEASSWSCAHGVERWRADCGCSTGGNAGWNQQWRAPLRAALDWLRDAVRPSWDEAAARLFHDAEAARDAYIHVLLDRTRDRQQEYFTRYAVQPLTPEEQTRILQLMEIERHLQLMVTSCGWFFDDLGGIETVQILSYAGRVIELAAILFPELAASLQAGFLARIEAARSNVPERTTGAELYRRTMASQRVTLEQAAVDYAIISLFEPLPDETTRYSYRLRRRPGETHRGSRGRFAWGQVEVFSQITLEHAGFEYAVLHPGDLNLSAAVRPADPASFALFAEQMRVAAGNANAVEAVGPLLANFGTACYTLSTLFQDDQRRILKLLLNSTLAQMESALRTIYEDHRALLRYLSVAGMQRPQALLFAAEFSLNADLRRALTSQPVDVDGVRAVLAQAKAGEVSLDGFSLGFMASQRMLGVMLGLQQNRTQPGLTGALALIDVLRELPFAVDLWEPQNRWYRILERCTADPKTTREWLRKFQDLGTRLNIDVAQLQVEN